MSEASVYQDLRGHLATLRLAAAAGEALPAELDKARAQKSSHTAFAESLLSIEVDATPLSESSELSFPRMPRPRKPSSLLELAASKRTEASAGAAVG